MAIRSGPFSGVILSGPDVQKFERQIARAKPSKAAVATVISGHKLASEFNARGYATLKAKSAKK